MKEKNEKGFVLILALVTMVAMTVIGVSLVMNMNVDMKLSRNERDAKQAFQLAEAGIQEAVARFRLPKANAKYAAESPDNAGYPNIGYSTSFSYDSGVIGDIGTGTYNYAVQVSYLTEQGNSETFCDANDNSPNTSNDTGADPNFGTTPWACVTATNEVVMFGQDFNLGSNVTKTAVGKHPVYRVASTGTANSVTRNIVAYIGSSSLNTDTDDAINTNGCITNNGGAAVSTICGDNTCGSADCDTVKGAATDLDEHLGDTIANVVASADTRLSCTTVAECNAVIPTVSDAQWGDWTGDGWSVMVYINNTSGSPVSITGNDLGADNGGRGILIVSGDLDLSGGFQWEGLIYVLGTLTLNGGGAGVNVTGGIMAESTTTLNGSSLNINYDQATLEEVARQSSSSAVILWKRL